MKELVQHEGVCSLVPAFAKFRGYVMCRFCVAQAKNVHTHNEMLCWRAEADAARKFAGIYRPGRVVPLAAAVMGLEYRMDEAREKMRRHLASVESDQELSDD